MRLLIPFLCIFIGLSSPLLADELILVGGGDVAYPTGWFSELAAKRGTRLFNGIAPHLSEAHLRFLNLESPVTHLKPTAKKSYPMVMAPRFLRILHKVGFNLYSLANNHTGDAGEQGVKDTLAQLLSLSTPEKPLYWAGAGLSKAARSKTAYFSVPGTEARVAFLAFRLSGSKLANPMGRKNAERQIRQAAKKADFIVVSAHGGGEYKAVPGQWKARRWRAMIDAGAHVILGHGPHNTQGVELYKHGVIYYSLGNLSFGTRPGKKRTGGMLLRGQLARVIFQNGAIKSAQVLPLFVDNTRPWKVAGKSMPVRVFTPTPLPDEHAAVYLRQLQENSSAIPGNTTRIARCGQFYCMARE